jgi:hypothetical protein
MPTETVPQVFERRPTAVLRQVGALPWLAPSGLPEGAPRVVDSSSWNHADRPLPRSSVPRKPMFEPAGLERVRVDWLAGVGV